MLAASINLDAIGIVKPLQEGTVKVVSDNYPMITIDVLIGAGLSSSAAFETLIGTILSGLYNDMKVSPVEIAIIVQYQNVSIALAIRDTILGDDGVCRIHGGGFAGTIQAFVKNEVVEKYKKNMDHIFGEGSCNVLKIRKFGGMKVI